MCPLASYTLPVASSCSLTMILKLTATLFTSLSCRRQAPLTPTRLEMIPPMTSTTIPKSKYQDLLDWLKSQNGQVNDKVYIDESALGGGFGAFVSDTVNEGDVLFTVPRTACVTLEAATSDKQCGETFQKVMEKAGPGGNTVVMAAYLAKEFLISMKQDVPYGPYLETLPWERGINSQEHILFWTNADIDASLGGSFCFSEANELRSEVALATKIIESIVGDSIRIARGELQDGFKWPWQITPQERQPINGLDQAVRGAFVSLLTRAFQDGEGDEEKLVPVLDMLQHSEEPNVRHAMRKEDGTVEVRARRTIQAGEELLNQYRSEEDENMPYHRFFTRFGFVPGVNEPVENLLGDKSSIFYPKIVEV